MIESKALSDARIMVVGCGSLGNEVLKDLVLLGVQHLVLVDFDRVETSNLSRTVLFTPGDVGRQKVDAARDRLKMMNPSIDVVALSADIVHDVPLSLIAEMDVVVSCVDSRWVRFIINRHCMRMGRTWVDGGITQTEGSVRVFGNKVANCYACSLGNLGMNELRRRMPCSNTIRRMEQTGHVPTGIIPASVIGAVMAQQVLQVIQGETSLKGYMFTFDSDTLQGRKVLLEAYDDDCVEHEEWTPVKPSSIGMDSTVRNALAVLGTFYLREDVFVDYIIDRCDDHRYEIMLPGRKVVECMERDKRLQGRLTSDFYQHEYRMVDSTFPYQQLTLKQLGIPSGDVLQTETGYYKLNRPTSCTKR